MFRAPARTLAETSAQPADTLKLRGSSFNVSCENVPAESNSVHGRSSSPALASNVSPGLIFTRPFFVQPAPAGPAMKQRLDWHGGLRNQERVDLLERRGGDALVNHFARRRARGSVVRGVRRLASIAKGLMHSVHSMLVPAGKGRS